MLPVAFHDFAGETQAVHNNGSTETGCRKAPNRRFFSCCTQRIEVQYYYIPTRAIHNNFITVSRPVHGERSPRWRRPAVQQRFTHCRRLHRIIEQTPEGYIRTTRLNNNHNNIVYEFAARVVRDIFFLKRFFFSFPSAAVNGRILLLRARTTITPYARSELYEFGPLLTVFAFHYLTL